MVDRRIVLALVMAAGSLLHGQEFRATLMGRVLDAAGAAVPGAKVRVTNAGTGESRDVTTDSQGNYLAPLLNPATYNVKAEAQGFKTAVQEGLQLAVNQTATLDLKLEVGAMTTQVTVTAEAPLLEAANADRGGVIDEESVKEFPLNTRNPFMLAMLAPGVNFDGELIYQRPFDNGAIAEWSINGSQRKNEFLLDGAPNNAQAGGNNIAYVPPVDSVQEFKIQSNSYDAQYGRSAGGIINVVLKSGENKVHGTGYEFARRSMWDANSFQNNSRCLTVDAQGKCHGAPKDGHWLDQYGFQLSGPVYIPKLYNGRNKTFFTVNYERYREGTPQPLILSVPEPEMRQGDFTKLKDAGAHAITVYDPDTGRTVGTQYVRQPFAGNVIPKNRLSPTALELMKYYPLPNTSTPGVAYSSSNYFISGGEGTARDRFYNFVAKVDRNVDDRNHVFVRFANNDRTEMRTTNGIFDKPGADGQLPLRRANWTGAVNWTSSLKPTLLLDVRSSLSRFIDPATAEANRNFDLVGAGFSSKFVSQLPYGSWFPRLNISTNPTMTSLGRSTFFSATNTNTLSLQPSVNYFHGSRTWKAGLDMRWTQYSTQSSGTILTFTAADTFTRADYQRADNLSGSGLASWLLGIPTSGTVNINMFPIHMFPYYAGYVQHDWRVNHKLTVNLGIRWDLNIAPRERFNRMNRGFDKEVISPVDKMIDHTTFNYLNYPLRGGLRFAGIDGAPERAADTYWKAFQPRFGFAYSLGRKTVIRGGWGRYYINPNNDYLQTTGYSASTSLSASLDSNRTVVPNLLSDPFPIVNQPVGASRGLSTFLGNGFSFVNTKFETPKMDSFSLDIQRAINNRSRFSIAYVGSRGKRLQSSKSYNEDDDSAIRERCNFLSGATSQTYCTQTLNNPFRNLPGFEGTTHYTATTRSRYELNRPFPQFTSGLNELMRNDGLSWYNAAQASFNWRARGGMNLNANYTFSKSMERRDYLDAMNDVMQQGLTSNDRPHKLVYSMIWQLPVGKGRRFFGGARGVTGKLISGWEATSIFQIFSGRPWALPSNVIYLKDARNPKFTWDAPRIQGVLPCVKSWNNTNTVTWQSYSVDYGCTEANFVIVPSYNPRYTPYYEGRIRMQRVRLLDASLNKMTRLTERYSLQFRLESFNVLNSFFMNNATFTNGTGDANFGSVIKNTLSAGATNYPRHVQMGVKFIW
jgi:hypothetical protein